MDTNNLNKVNKKPKIMLGLPTMSSMHTLLSVIIMGWVAEAAKTGEYNLSIYPTCSISPVDRARNEIVEAFLKSDCTHLFFIDADTIPPQDALKRLLAGNRDIVTAITPIVDYDEVAKEFYRKWNCVDQNDNHVKPNTGIIQCKGAGSSCIMIRRNVFEKMKKPWYEFIYKDDTGKDVNVGEDIAFVIKALSLGSNTYADTSIICRHYKSTLW